ncbi:MAG: hypothetical protein RL755_1209 [Pseudomonadota bacterium]|jgi:hypothetical protein
MNFQEHQSAFAAYIRNPDHNRIPKGVSHERMAIYRELFFNNIAGFLTANFPVLHRLMDDNAWRRLSQDFFSQHVCHTPHFSEISEEFLSYLQHERQCAEDLPFMVELAHYEWIEMALSIAHGAITPFVGSLTEIPLQLSPLACVLAYQFPVHRICPEFLPTTVPEQATFLVVYRDEDENVQFLEITPLTYQLLQLLQAQPEQLAHVYLKQLATLFPAINEEILNQKGEEILTLLAMRGVVISTNGC